MEFTDLRPPSLYKQFAPFAIFLLAVAALVIWEYLIRQEIRKNGVYTKAVVNNVEGYKGGGAPRK